MQDRLDKIQILNKLDNKFREEIKSNPKSEIAHAYRLGLKDASLAVSKVIEKLVIENSKDGQT